MSLQQSISRITDVNMRETVNEQQTVVSFSAGQCDGERLEEIYKLIIGKMLGGRDVIVVTKDESLLELISDEVGKKDRERVKQSVEVVRFTPPDSVEHRATLVKNVPTAVVEDLASCSEFVYGNLWFLINSSSDANQLRGDVIGDICKLTPSAFDQIPVLCSEAVAAPAMYDGLEILWFKPDEHVYQTLIKPLFDSQPMTRQLNEATHFHKATALIE